MPFVFSGFYAFLEIFQKPPDGDEHRQATQVFLCKNQGSWEEPPGG